MEANATRHSHAAPPVYKPSYVGRLIHADIVGPFRLSITGHFKYILVLTDDHSRFKSVYFMKAKSEAIQKVKTYVASLNAHVNEGKAHPTNIVGSLHTDNAGEFLSHEFKEFMDEASIRQTTCPPHVHSLNGVAERSIRSIIENARSHLVASGAPNSFWPYAVEHAVNVLNRCTGPPGSDKSSHELLYGKQPRILPLQAFGCRAVAVLPRVSYSKTELDSHGVAGINLGLCPNMTSSYRIWIPTRGKIVNTSDVYFDETFMPWREDGDQRVGPVLPHSAPADSSTSSPPAVDGSILPNPSSSVGEAFDLATRGATATARSSRRVLLLFSGPYNRPDSLAFYLKHHGLDPELVDNCVSGGNPAHDLLDDDFYHSLLRRVRAGEFCCIFAAPPCSTFSVSRFFPPSDGKPGPSPVRDREHVDGLPNLAPRLRSELLNANAIVARTAALLAAGWARGTQFAVESPVDRGDPTYPRHFLTRRHAPLWLTTTMLALTKATGARLVHFAQCSFGAPVQKRTSILFTAGLEPWLGQLSKATCDHTEHKGQVGGTRDEMGNWDSRAAAAYPAGLNYFLARSIASLHQIAASVVAPAPLASSPEKGSNEPLHIDEPSTVVPDVAPPAADRPSLPSPPPAPVFDPPPAGPSVSDSAPPPAPAPAPSDPSVRDKAVWGERKLKGSPIRAALRPRPARALLLLANAALSLGPIHHKAFLAAEPKSRAQALSFDHPGWTKSMDKEIKNHETNGSWEWIPIHLVPTDRRLIKLIWVFKVKRDGSLKSRLCVQGCNQVEGIDYDQSFSAALRSPSLRMLAAVAAKRHMHLRRWDFVSAYLQGSLEEGEVTYCHPPPGYERTDDKGRRLVCKVVKPVYGMVQAGRRWQRSLFPWLERFGFVQSKHDPCMFQMTRKTGTGKKRREESLLLGVYVDDLAIAYKDKSEGSLYHDFTVALKEWQVEDEGELHDLLGVEFERSDGHIHLKQPAYISKMVERYFRDGVPPASSSTETPCGKELKALVDRVTSSVKDVKLADRPRIDPKLLTEYQSLVGALLYCATNTRPDIAYALGQLCRAMSCPTEDLLVAAHRVLLYLYYSRDLGLRYSASERPIYGMSDSDWDVRHSTSGYVFMLCEAAISWSSKRQTSVALSSCEAEIVAGSEAAKEAVHQSGLAAEYDAIGSDPIDLFMDNESGIKVAYNPEHFGRMKHVDRRHFFVRECVEEHKLRVPYVATADNLADFLTKAQPADVFIRMRNIIMNVPS